MLLALTPGPAMEPLQQHWIRQRVQLFVLEGQAWLWVLLLTLMCQAAQVLLEG